LIRSRVVREHDTLIIIEHRNRLKNKKSVLPAFFGRAEPKCIPYEQHPHDGIGASNMELQSVKRYDDISVRGVLFV
jgi:hypothetical protein